ncbi:MAG TPA: hypothetical protein VHB79_23285 [Polyangiaceae bacterium]|nr:hypothetical protein [Polyangiaceae bacterium]
MRSTRLILALGLSCALPVRAQPAPPHPEAESPSETSEAPAAPGKSSEIDDELSLAPTQGEASGDTAPPPERGQGVAAGGFEIHGYLRAPLRLSIGPKNDRSSGNELHAPARVPDASFTDWRYLNLMPGPWSELFFSYGSPRASATISIAGYNQTIAGYRDLEAQLGINQAFVTLQFPGTFGRYGDLSLTAGSFSNRYGTAGKHDAGMYQTYLFGRTKVVGETLTAKLWLSPQVGLVLEHGFGGKLDSVPFDTLNPRPDYLPYPGPVPQGSSFVNHAHLGLDLGKSVRLAGHYLRAWTPDDHNAPGTTSVPGSMTIVGGEAHLLGGAAGDGYLGFSHIAAHHVRPLSDVIEVLHSSGGYELKNNFFGRYDPRTKITPPDDSGRIESILGQYTLSLGKLVRYPARFNGNGPDLSLTLFGMYNVVRSDTFDHEMLKLGAEAFYSLIEVLGIGVRFDQVNPDMADSKQSFSVLSPRIVLRTRFLGRERVILQYSHYFLGRSAYPAFPYNTAPEADKNAVMLSASMAF